MTLMRHCVRLQPVDSKISPAWHLPILPCGKTSVWTNRNQILELIDTYVNALKETRNTIAESHPEEIKEFFSSAKEYRDSFNISHRGPIRPVYQLFCDLIDEAGGIATIATILASNNISIKNIGIIHNREFQQGVLQVEFYDSNAYDHAVELLRKYHYTVYEK